MFGDFIYSKSVSVVYESYKGMKVKVKIKEIGCRYHRASYTIAMLWLPTYPMKNWRRKDRLE